uniref:Uncharacterized protein n=1 Tax=viral metagenome TaxID=1070528 RepID=A0A6C0I841_9ZZZZ
MPSAVLTASKFEVNSISFGKHKPNANGGYNIEITVGDSTSESLIQTPKMRAPFGISTDKTNPFKKSLDVSFQGIESSSSIKSFRDLIESVDKMTIDYAMKNSKTFFKKELSREIISDYYYSGIKLSKKEQYSDTFKFKILFLKPNPEKNLPNGKYLTTFWNPNGDEQNELYLDKGDSVVGLLKPQMLWVANRSFGITWVCTQLRIHKQVKVSGYAFKKTDEDPEDHESIESVEEIEEEEEIEEVEVDDE